MKLISSTLAFALLLTPALGLHAEDMSMNKTPGATTNKSVADPAPAPAKAKKAKKAKAVKAEAKESWTCSMHPEVHMDHAGQCPQCGMDLIKEKKASK